MIQTMRGMLFPVALLALLLFGYPSSAPAQDLLLLRVESLEGIRADARALHGEQEVSLEMLDSALGLFGLDGVSQLDADRPLVLALPMQGLMLAQRGLVAALPVTDTGAVLDSMAARFDGHAVEDDGLQVFSSAEGPSLFVRPHEGYLILGGTRELVTGFDARAALAPREGLAGNTRMELHLEQAAPMVKMGLMGARQQVLAQMQQKAVQGEDALPFDPARMEPLLDVYFGLIGTMLDNVSSVQLAVEVRDDHLIVHERFLPKAGSTLAGLAAAQTPGPRGLPDMAGMLSPEAVMVAVGDMEMTPAARTALQELVRGYLGAALPIAGDLMARAAGEGAPELPMDALLAEIDFQVDRMLRCSGSRSVASFDFAPGGGISFLQAYDWSEEAACRVDFAEEISRAGGLLETLPIISEIVSFTAGPPVAGSATATTTVELGAILRKLGMNEPQAQRIVEELYGRTLTEREAYGKGRYVVTGGAGAESRLAALLGASPAVRGGGLGSEAFQPLSPGAASYVRFDLGRLLARIQEVLPPEARTDPALTLLAKELNGPAGRVAMGIRFDSGGPTFEAALPLEAVRLFLGLHERMHAAARCPRSTQECVEAMSAQAKRVGLIGLEGVYDSAIGGYRVDSFIAGSNAEAAGIRTGDVLVKVNGIPLSDGQAASADEPSRAPGMTVELTLLRGGEEVTLSVEVIEKPAEILARELGEHLLEDHAGH